MLMMVVVVMVALVTVLAGGDESEGKSQRGSEAENLEHTLCSWLHGSWKMD